MFSQDVNAVPCTTAETSERVRASHWLCQLSFGEMPTLSSGQLLGCCWETISGWQLLWGGGTGGGGAVSSCQFLIDNCWGTVPWGQFLLARGHSLVDNYRGDSSQKTLSGWQLQGGQFPEDNFCWTIAGRQLLGTISAGQLPVGQLPDGLYYWQLVSDVLVRGLTSFVFMFISIQVVFKFISIQQKLSSNSHL